MGQKLRGLAEEIDRAQATLDYLIGKFIEWLTDPILSGLDLPPQLIAVAVFLWLMNRRLSQQQGGT